MIGIKVYIYILLILSWDSTNSYRKKPWFHSLFWYSISVFSADTSSMTSDKPSDEADFVMRIFPLRRGQQSPWIYFTVQLLALTRPYQEINSSFSQIYKAKFHWITARWIRAFQPYGILCPTMQHSCRAVYLLSPPYSDIIYSFTWFCNGNSSINSVFSESRSHHHSY